MKRGLLLVLCLVGLAAIVLPWRFGIVWLLAPALALGALSLVGVMGRYDEDATLEVEPFLAEHGVKLLALSGLLCVIGVIGGVRSCQGESDVGPAELAPLEPSRDYIRERAREPASAPSEAAPARPPRR